MAALRYLFIAILLLSASSTAALADKRVALIIGNSAYKSVPRLTNPPMTPGWSATCFAMPASTGST